MKTNKSFTKRIRATKNGKLIGRKSGFNHFNAKQRRVKQLAGKRGVEIKMNAKDRARFFPGI